ncbi:hypothetical protein SAMN05518861_109182 [Mesorhizobium sp. YR577]|nr:hypothetical protein SAMN05518861_109182 [Mesorhizobium sp. YR577]
MSGAALSLPFEGRVAAKRSGGVAREGRGLISSTRAAATTPSGCCAAISPSRGEKSRRAS